MLQGDAGITAFRFQFSRSCPAPLRIVVGIKSGTLASYESYANLYHAETRATRHTWSISGGAALNWLKHLGKTPQAIYGASAQVETADLVKTEDLDRWCR
jgi:hypothetical protein